MAAFQLCTNPTAWSNRRIADAFIEDAQLVLLTHFVEGEQVDAMRSSKLSQGWEVGYSQKATLAWGGHMIKHVTGPAVRPYQGTDVVAGGPTKNRCGQQNVQLQIAAVGVLNTEQAIVPTVDMKACLTRVRGSVAWNWSPLAISARFRGRPVLNSRTVAGTRASSTAEQLLANGQAVLDATSLVGSPVLRARAENWASPVAITTTAVGSSSST